MANMDISGSIASALASRTSQREPTRLLSEAWENLTKSVEHLNDALEEAHSQFSRGRHVPGAAGIVQGLNRWRGHNDLLTLPARLKDQAEGVDGIRDRALRETVNVGVIGRTGSGKSTFLQVVTNLEAHVVPRGDGLNPTTAARSRFQHDRNRREAEVTMLAWEEFRERYIAPLHAEADCPGEPPFTKGAFLRYDYERRLATASQRQDSGEKPTAQGALARLIRAQRSFGSYEHLLGAGRRSVPLAELRPYVAYPPDLKGPDHPYHAVKDVRVFHPFIVDIEKLVMVDLPGAGETGLNINRRFLADLKYDVDVLLHIVYPQSGRPGFDEAEGKILDLASSAKIDREWGHFIYIVINENLAQPRGGEYVANVRKGADQYAQHSGYTVLSGDASNKNDARDRILLPVLGQLTGTLKDMDRAVAGHAAREARAAAANTAEVVGRLADDVDQWRVHVPPEEQELVARATRLRDQVALSLKSMSEKYARRAQAKESLREVDDSIADAVARLREWADGQFAATGDSDWQVRMTERFAAARGRAMDEACTLARVTLRREFGRVDASLDAGKREVHAEVARILHSHFKEGLAPAGDDSFTALSAKTRELGLVRLHAALADLIAFDTGYGSIFPRVGRQVVAEIKWEHFMASRASSPSGLAAPQPGRPSPLFDGMHALKGGVRAAARIGGLAGAGVPVGTLSIADFAATLAAATVVGEAIAPILAEWLWPAFNSNDISVESFRRALATAFDRAVDLIAERMRVEAAQLIEALAAIVDEFYDGFTKVPDIEPEYKDLTHDFRNELWPGAVDGSAADLAQGLTGLRQAATDTLAAAQEAIELAERLTPAR
jgi:energy-coupling factor transporter ATP-binding protein EcfA2